MEKDAEEIDKDIQMFSGAEFGREDFNYPSFGRGTGQIVDTQEAVNDKIMSSANKYRQVILTFPKTSEQYVALPLLDENRNIVYDAEGNPVIKSVRKMKIFEGLEEKKLKFPIEDWFNDSVTSSFLSKKEAAFVRFCDFFGFELYLETIENWPNINWLGMINEVYWAKASIADSAKGIEGQGVKQAKSTYSHAENVNRDFRDDKEFQQFKKAKYGGPMGWINRHILRI